MIIASIYMLCIYYLQEKSDIDFKRWDVNTVTASDFTVQMEITEEQWKYFKLD